MEGNQLLQLVPWERQEKGEINLIRQLVPWERGGKGESVRSYKGCPGKERKRWNQLISWKGEGWK